MFLIFSQDQSDPNFVAQYRNPTSLSLQVLWVKTPTSQRSSGLHQKCVQPVIWWRTTRSTGGTMSRFFPSSCPTFHPTVSSQVHSLFSKELISHECNDLREMYFILLPACVNAVELNKHEIHQCICEHIFIDQLASCTDNSDSVVAWFNNHNGKVCVISASEKHRNSKANRGKIYYWFRLTEDD